MGKIVYPLFFAFAIQFVLILFAGQEIPGSALYTFLANPTSWSTTALFGALSDVLLVAGTAAIVAGLYFIRNEWIVYSGLGFIFFSFGASFYNAWQFVNQHANWGDGGALAATIFIAPLILVFIIAVLSFTRGRD